MSPTFVIAAMTFHEARRNRVLWSLAAFFVVLVLTSVLLQEVTFTAYDRIVRDLGFATISAFGVIVSIFLGVSAVTREIERKTAYYVLTKPVSRASYLVGKLLGVWMTLAITLGAMFALFCAEQLVFGFALSPVFLQAFLLLLMELGILISFAILASSFTNSLMASLMVGTLFTVGHLSGDVYVITRRSTSPVTKAIGGVLVWLFPDLERLNLKTSLALLETVDWSSVATATVYASFYVVAFMAAAELIFSKRDLK